jgi:tetratricopeptide (TPR) repeat protein
MGTNMSERGLGHRFRLMGLVLLVAAVGAAVVLSLRSAPQQANGEPGPATRAGAAPEQAIAAVLSSADEYIRTGENGKAEAILQAALREHVEEPRLYVKYAQLLAGQKRLEESYALYVKALACGPRDAPTEFAAGTLANMCGKLDAAEAHYAAAQSAEPSDWRAPLFLAQVQVKLDNTEEAKKNLLIAANLKPDTAIAWGTLAELALREDKTSIALQHIAKAREIEPRVTAWRVVEARTLKRQGKAEQALGLLVGLDEAQRREPGVMQVMAECFGMLQRPGDAAAMYMQSSDSEPTRGDWAFEAALWLERAGDPKLGAEYAKRAAALNIKGAQALADRLAR